MPVSEILQGPDVAAADDARRLLVVEDNEVFTEIVREALPGTAWTVIDCPDLATAETAVREETFDVVLLDLGLPDSLGEATFDRMSSLVGQTPVVIMTNDGMRDLGRRLVRRGAADFIAKGDFDPEHLRWALDAAFDRRAHADEARSARIAALLASERQRIARDLHDDVIQQIFAALLELARIDRDAGEIDRIEVLLDGAIDDLRHALDQMRSDGELQLTERLQLVCDQLSASSGRSIDLRLCQRLDEVDDRLGRAIVAVVREGTTNAIRHARGRISVSLRADRGLEVEIRSGPPTKTTTHDPRSFGLAGLHDRAGEFGGHCEFRRDDAGAVLRWSTRPAR